MRVLIIVDKKKSAIHRLALPIQKHNPHLKIEILPFHPKRYTPEDAKKATDLLEWADLVHVSYWKSGAKLKELFPDKFAAKPKVLWHHNPYDIDQERWPDTYKVTVVSTGSIRDNIPYAKLIPQGIDLRFFAFNGNYAKDGPVLMVAARIEGKKGIQEVAEACKELDRPFVLVGRISDGEYAQKVFDLGAEFHEDVSEEELRDLYYKSSLLVCNSTDNFESGPLPVLEAMACGVPVLTRNVGHIPDLYNGENMEVRLGPPEDVSDIKEKISFLLRHPEVREKLRDKAWQTVKGRDERKMARQFSHLYYHILTDGHPLVSVVIPTFDRPGPLSESLVAVCAQSYPYKEIVVADSGNTSVEPIILELRKHVDVPIKYIRFDNQGEYTLPKARNLAVMEAEGQEIVFCDDRFRMKEDAVSAFVRNIRKRTWLWGVKDGFEKAFVENFSCVNREELITRGGFNERIDCYGGATQEINTRMGGSGMDFFPVPSAQCEEIAKSANRTRKRADIIEAKFKIWKLYGGGEE